MQKIKLVEQHLDFRTVEAYKTLRTNVSFSGDNIRVVTITSCIPNEGKSTTALALAKAFAESGRRTLLIDADLRKSEMKKHVKEGKVRGGLTNFLTGQATIMDILVETDLPNLFMIFAGHVSPNPSELLGNDHFKALVEAARKSFDMIIIDTPPIASVIDAAVVSRQTDGVIVVMRFATISYQLAQRLKDQFDAAGVRILGVVLNEVGTKVSKGRSYGKYYERYYKRYYKKYYGGYYGDYYRKEQE